MNSEEERIDDWNLALDFHVFAKHETRRVYSRNLQQPVVLECVEALTPVDMMNLGSGIHDATGHCVWMGAFLLIDCLSVAHDYFMNKRVLELGSGTGIGGIALLCSKTATPAYVIFTDADPNALELCRRNCKHNNLASYTVCELTWGGPLPTCLSASVGSSSCQPKMDTVLATDVLYDIGLLRPLFQTARGCLVRPGGVFVLSHVPRACYSSEHPPVDNLEDYIVKSAKEFSFELKEILRPCSLEEETRPDDALNNVSLKEMEQVGAAILVFVLDKTTAK